MSDLSGSANLQDVVLHSGKRRVMNGASVSQKIYSKPILKS